ncbi:MAG TPA: TatD family hydrolase [Candidatus Moranbacteria bacterium]|nr:TatD family hydrolase [Candidatus Moranbacteria bacterium]
MLIDTHAHLNFSAFKDDHEEVIKRCSDTKVGVINVGSEYKTSKRAVEMAEKYDGLWAVVGLHPIHLGSQDFKDKEEGIDIKSAVEKFEAEKYRELAKNKKVVAIGEMGLDFFHNDQNKNEQAETFKEGIDLAVELDLPVMIHCRKANNEVIEILEEKKKEYGEKLRGVVHCFSGNLKQAERYTQLGFMLGFNGIITFARDYDKVLRNIGIEHMVVETDCPYLTPIPHRGERNEPAYVRFVAEKIAEIKGVTLEEIAKATTKNAKSMFRI